MDVKILADYGIDYPTGLSRCMNDEGFYKQLLGMFLEDDAFFRGKAAYESGDMRKLFACMHELKGACGNAAMAELYDAVCPLVELLRSGGGTAEETAKLFDLAESAYMRAREGVAMALNG